MNYTELQAAIIDDTHKSDYAGTTVQRMITEGEALIRAFLHTYGMETTLTDADRIEADSNIYNLPTRCKQVRQVIRADGLPLDQLDESGIHSLRNLTSTIGYAVRPLTIVLAANPAAESEFKLFYFGLPEPLSDDASTNTLLDDYPQLYKHAASVYVFERSQDYESANRALDATRTLCSTINSNVKRLLGGSRAVNAYNVAFRSSY